MPTGTVTVALDDAGQPAFTIHRPAAYDCIPTLTVNFDPDWICFGTLHQTTPAMRRLTESLIEAHPRARRFYDVNLRQDYYDAEVLTTSLQHANAVKLNDDELPVVARLCGLSAAPPVDQLRALCDRFALH